VLTKTPFLNWAFVQTTGAVVAVGTGLAVGDETAVDVGATGVGVEVEGIDVEVGTGVDVEAGWVGVEVGKTVLVGEGVGGNGVGVEGVGVDVDAAPPLTDQTWKSLA
jgi:hypothetical protein